MSRNQTGGTELIPMPHPTGAAQLSLPIILYSAVVGLAGSSCRLPFPHLPPVTTSCVISQIRQLSGGLVTHLTQLLRCQLFHQSYVLSLSFLILKIKLLIYQLGILALCLLVKHCQNLK